MSDLLHVNVNEHTEKKGNLTYLSWAWAWAEVLKADPLATWIVHTYGPPEAAQPCMWIGETAMVHTSVTVKGLRRECMLPVMDHKNNAMKNPDSRKISDAIMRCMTKAISMHGLGLYIYAGEDLPEGDDSAEKPETKPTVAVPHFPKVADLVLGDNEAISPETKTYLDELAASIQENFTKAGPAKSDERIETEGLDAIQLIYLSTQLPTPMRNAIKAASVKRHQPTKEHA